MTEIKLRLQRHFKFCLSSTFCQSPDFDTVNAGSSFNGPFPFFELPREIRDYVYSIFFETQIIDVLPSHMPSKTSQTCPSHL